MGSKSPPPPPPPPNPFEVAKAQTGTNIGTSIANTLMGNANEYTPWGSVEYKQRGTQRLGVPGGALGGLQPPPEHIRFDGQAYLAANPDIAADAGFAADPYKHWQQSGRAEGRPGGALYFNPDEYLKANPDVAGSGLDPWQHWQEYGSKEGRSGGAGDLPYVGPAGSGGGAGQGGGQGGGGAGRQGGGGTEFYDIPLWDRIVTLSPDEQKKYEQQNQLAHGLNQFAINQTGMLRNTLGVPVGQSFDAQAYLQANPDVAQAGLDPLQHWIEHGQREGRSGGPVNQLDRLSGPGQLPGAGPQFENVGHGPQFSNVNLTQSLGNVGDVQRQLAMNGDLSSERQRIEQALFDRINPELDRKQAALETQLVNQGFQRGTQAFDDAMQQHLKMENDARLAIVGQGGDEMARMFGIDLSRGKFSNEAQQQAFQQDAFGRAFGNEAQMQQAGFNNQHAQLGFENDMARIQANNAMAQQGFGNQLNLASATDTQRERQLQEMLALRNQPINEISALMSGGQVNVPQFAPYQHGNVADTPVGDYIYKSADIERQNWMFQAQQKNAGMGGMFSGIGSLFGALGMFSDRRLKRDIRDTGIRLLNGLKIYAYCYAGSARQMIGVLADEVEKVKPQAVFEVGGFKAVDYGLASEAA